MAYYNELLNIFNEWPVEMCELVASYLVNPVSKLIGSINNGKYVNRGNFLICDNTIYVICPSDIKCVWPPKCGIDSFTSSKWCNNEIRQIGSLPTDFGIHYILNDGRLLVSRLKKLYIMHKDRTQPMGATSQPMIANYPYALQYIGNYKNGELYAKSHWVNDREILIIGLNFEILIIDGFIITQTFIKQTANYDGTDRIIDNLLITNNGHIIAITFSILFISRKPISEMLMINTSFNTSYRKKEQMYSILCLPSEIAEKQIYLRNNIFVCKTIQEQMIIIDILNRNILRIIDDISNCLLLNNGDILYNCEKRSYNGWILRYDGSIIECIASDIIYVDYSGIQLFEAGYRIFYEKICNYFVHPTELGNNMIAVWPNTKSMNIWGW